MADDRSSRPDSFREQREATDELHRAAKCNDMDALKECLAEGIDIDAANSKGLTALHLACREGRLEIVRELLSKGANIQAISKKHNTPLHVASLGGKLEIVKELIKQGADVNAQAENGMTSLYMAAQENHIGIAKVLLNHDANPNLSASGGFDPVDVAIQQKHPEMTAFLSEYGSKKGFKALHVIARKDDTNAASLLLKNGYDPNVTAPNGYTPLHIAAKYGSINTALLLIENSAKVDALAKHKISPLHVAAKHGQPDIVSLLIEADAPLNAATKDGLTPLHCAARDGHESCVELLLVHNASLTAKTKHGLTALHMAAQGNHVNCANYLLGHGCHIDSPTSEGVTPLHVAAHYGNLNIAQLLLDRGADIDCRAKNGYTALHVACKKNREAVVQLLIKYGADVHLKNANGQTALHLAAFFGMVNIVLLLIQNGASIEVTTVREETILHIACRTRQITIVRLLLRNGAKVDPRSKLEETPLLIACRQRCEEIVSLLLDDGADPDARNKGESTPLHMAARDGNEAIIECLLDHGACVELKNKHQYTPLHEAAKGGHSAVAQMLIEKGANVNSQAKSNLHPLHLACHYRNFDTAVLLIENGANLQAVAKNGFTPLHIASKKNDIELAIFLLGKGVDADSTTRNGISPLHIAAEEGNVDIADALLENGASPGIQTKNGLTPLHLAAKYNHIEVVKKLIKYAAPINAQTISGYTPLHIAAFYGNTKIANLLLQDGADVEAKTKNANTPLHMAALRGHTNMVGILMKYNAPTNTLNKDGYTALYIAEVTHQTIIIETLVKVTHVIIKRKEEKQTAEKLKLTFALPEELEETQLIESADESDAEASIDKFQVNEDFQESFLGFEESTAPESGIESIAADSTTESVATYVTESPVRLQETTAPVFEFTPPGILLTSERNDMVGNGMTIEPPITGSFLISFLVDARGGSFESTQTGIRVSIPRDACAMPTRIMCRLQRNNKKVLLPKMAKNEGLVSRIIELEPQGIQFLKPVTIEVPHFGSLRKRERELIVLRSDPDSDYWREHVSTRIHSEFNEEDGFTEMPTSPEHGSKSGTQFVRIVTQDFPERFVVLARPRKEKFLMFPEGGSLKSCILPKAQVLFTENTLNMSTKIVMQVQLMDESHLHPEETAHFSSVIKLEPHMKLLNPVTVSLPCPWITPDQTFAVSPNLRLMALMPSNVKDMNDNSDWSWNDVTEICCLTAIESCCRFQTTFLTTYWLIEYNIPEKVPAKAESLFPKICSLPFLTKFVIFARGLTADTSELRVFCTTEACAENTLEKQEGLVEVARSRDVEVYDGQTIHLTCAGNMTPATKNLKMNFRAFRENRLTFKVSALNSWKTWSCSIGFIGSLRPESSGRVPELCNVDAVIPESVLRHEVRSPQNTGYQVSDDLIQKISRNIGDSWKQLAINLGMTETEIQGVIDLSSDNGELASITLLELWRSSRSDNATFEQLRNSLELLGRVDLCDLVESRSPTTLSPRSSNSGSFHISDQKPDEAVNLNSLLESENLHNHEESKFEFPEPSISQETSSNLKEAVRDVSGIMDSPLLVESPVDDSFEKESPFGNPPSEGDSQYEEIIATESQKRDYDMDFDALMQNVIDQYPYTEEDSPAHEEEPIAVANDCQAEESPDVLEDSGSNKIVPPCLKLEVCDELLVTEIRNIDEKKDINVECLNEVNEDKISENSEVGILEEKPADNEQYCPPVPNGDCIRSHGESPVSRSVDENSNLDRNDKVGSNQISAEISAESRTVVTDGVVSDKSHATLKDTEDTDIIRQMFGGDQSVMAFFDTPKQTDDEEGTKKGVTFI